MNPDAVSASGFSVQTRLTEKDYTNVMFFLLYRSWGYWLLAVTGFFLITGYPLLFWNEGRWQWMIVMYGFFLILWSPMRTALACRKNFRANKRIQETLIYTFGDGQMHVKGESFDTTCGWQGVYKVNETDRCFLIWQSRTQTNLLPKRDFTSEQQRLFREMVMQSGLKYRWR